MTEETTDGLQTTRKLRIGRIPFANLFPLFHSLETGFDCSGYDFVEGVPSRLNRMLREGEVDISPSSSIEYLRNRVLYEIIDGHSISSQGAVGSIFLFSSRPIGELGGREIAVTAQSETSTGLLCVILRKFYCLDCPLIVSEEPQVTTADAFLVIGDEALRCHYGVAAHALETARPYVYDLGELWRRFTGLPFVFALWIVRKKVVADPELRPLLEQLVRDLNAAKEMALKKLPDLAKAAPMQSFMSAQEILGYWGMLDYDLDERHKAGLALFGKYLREFSCS